MERFVPSGGITKAERVARAINAQPWDPPPGLAKRECPQCRYLFAALPDSEELRCRDCVGLSKRTASAVPT